MGNSPASHSIPSPDTDFISLEAFHAYTQNNTTPTYYQSTFSIAKLIEELRAKSDALQKSTLLPTIAMLEKAEAKFQSTNQTWDELRQQEEVEELMIHIFPSFFFAGQMGFIKAPFEGHVFRYQTDAIEELQSDDSWEIKVNPRKFMTPDMQTILMAGTAILNRFYKQEMNVFAGEGMVLRNRDTQAERHYRFDVQLDYLEVKLLKPLKELSKNRSINYSTTCMIKNSGSNTFHQRIFFLKDS